MKKRLLSLGMALCMVLTLVPISAFAEENSEVQTCICEAGCAEETRNTDCPICGAEGATTENCGKYEAHVEETEPEQTAVEKVQALIDALPDADTITEENRADVEAQLMAIDEAKLPLEDEWDALDFTKYNAAIAALNELDGMDGAEMLAVAEEATAESYFVFDKNTGTITGVTNDLPTEIVIPDTIDGVAVTTIGEDAFRACDGLTSITIPNSVTTIGEGAFAFCRNLTSITIPNSVTTIGEGAFRECHGLTSITIPNSVETIGAVAFKECDGLTSITIPNSVETIGEGAFEACDGLTSITIPNSVETIGGGAFRECYGLTSITISSKVTSIDRYMFSGCDSLTQINIDDGNTVYTSIDGVVFSKDKSKIIVVPEGINGAYTIPNSVTTIEAGAFERCLNLTNITIPKGVKTIGRGAFNSCRGLTSIIIPDGVETIEGFAFYGNYFSSVIISSSVKAIGERAFDGCRNLTNAYYLGTNEEWNVLIPNIGRNNLWLTNAVKCIAYNKSVNLVYDGQEKEVYTSQTDGVTIKYYQGTNEVSPINAGTYTAKVGDVEIGTFEIKKADQVAPNGLANTAETIDGKADGKITGVTSAMEYRKDGETDYTAITGTEITGLADGKYYVRYKADNNHNASDDTEITVATGRKLTVTVPTTQVGYTLTANKTELVWNDSVELTFALADGYSIAVNVNGNPITLDANDKYTVTDVQSDITVTVVGVTDITAPTGEIKLSTNSWKTIFNNITFGLFFKDAQEVTITATDNSGEAVKIEYLLSNKELTAEELATATFTVYSDKFNINPNNEYVIYSKLSDETGNVAYINSNGIVLDNIAPVITGIINGETYCEAQTVTVSDKYEVTVTVNGTPVTLDANGQFTLSTASGTQTVVAKDQAGNVSAEMIVTVNDGHEGGTATCTKKAVCKHCGLEYGEVDNSNHELEHNKENAATVTTTGNKEYWHCKDCKNNFSDKDGKNVIDLKDTVISKLAPEIIDGKGQSLTAGEKKELTFRSNAAYSDFIRVEVDGKTVDGKNYTAKEGSTIVTLKADYVATLSVGEHTLGIVSESGTATTTFTVNAKVVNDNTSPATGDNSHMTLWFALLFVSGSLLTVTGVYGKKKKYSVK